MKSRVFRRLVKKNPSVLLGGAHDALSAKLIEEAGYDAVWASSFGISAASYCLPDANVLTMTEALDAVKAINEAVSIPVIADADNGYGNAHNVIRMVREYERAGIAGISIEDNPFPKKCSLYPGERPQLVETNEMAGRIHAATSTRRNPDFFVIARTEALIAGLGMEEALERAAAYEEAGADAILIHSTKLTPVEIAEFGRRWKGKIPLVAVPTKYPDVTIAQLRKMNIRVVIFANQALRAAVTAMRETLAEMKKVQSLGSVSKKITPLSEIFKLVGQPGMEENDKKFVTGFKKRPSAVIVAAGFEKNLWPLTADRPKGALEIRGKTILERQVEMLKKCGIGRIAVVTGYKRERMPRLPDVVTYTNPKWKETHILHSLFLAEREMEGPFLFLYGDVLVDEVVIEKLLKSKNDVTLVVDRLPAKDPSLDRSTKLQRDWVSLRKNGAEGEEIASIGHHLESSKSHGEFAGLALFSKRGAKALREEYRRALKRSPSARFQNAASVRTAQFTDLLQQLLKRVKVHALCVRGGWLEIDSFEDYQKAWQTVEN